MSHRDPPDGTHSELDELPDRVTTLASRVSSWLPSVPPTSGERSGRSAIENSSSFSIDERGVPKEECVRRLLDGHGGRIYQTDVVESTEWSKATVSRVLAEMEQSGEVVRYAVGRQKVVCYPRRLPEEMDVETAQE